MGKQPPSDRLAKSRQETSLPVAQPERPPDLARDLTAQAEQVLADDPARACELAEQAYQAAERAGNREQMALASIQSGQARFLLGDCQAAQPLLQRGRQLAEQVRASRLLARALATLGANCAQTSQYGDALQYQLESLRLVQELRDAEGEARTLNNIGYLYMCLRDHGQALKYHRDACETARAIGHLPLEISASINMAVNHEVSGDPGLALQINQDSLAKIDGLSMGQFATTLRGNVASNLQALGRYSEALAACEQVLVTVGQLGLQESECDVRIVRAAALSRLGRQEEAVAELRAALKLAQTLPSPQHLREGNRELARILEELGDTAGALAAMRQYHELQRELLETISQERTRVLATQLQIDRLEFRAAEQQVRNEQLAAMNETLQAAQAELAYRATHDALTGLLNRPALERQLQAVCRDTPPQGMAVLFIDLDHFKQINDTLGHPVGDQLLQEVAGRLRRSVQPGDEVARQGGDEFTVLLRSVQNSAQAEQAAQHLLEQLSIPVIAGGHPLFISASIGIALFPQHGTDVTTLQKHADLALYRAKQERGCYRTYQPALGAEALEQLTVEQAMHGVLTPDGAVTTDGFSLQYQPVVDSRTRRPLMVEALLRWHGPWGEVPPQLFVPIAERSHLIVQLGAWTARTALRQLREWRQLWPELKVSVNVSARQLAQPDLAAQLAALLDECGLPPSALVVELTEAAAVDIRQLRAFQELQEAGLSIALDDVGTGYASLSSLAQLPLQMLKIDRSLTVQLAPLPQGNCGHAQTGQRRSTRPLMHALITFGRESGLQVVAEGVETPEQLELLECWGPIQIQGYLESPPLSTEDMTEYLQWKAQEEGT